MGMFVYYTDPINGSSVVRTSFVVTILYENSFEGGLILPAPGQYDLTIMEIGAFDGTVLSEPPAQYSEENRITPYIAFVSP